MSKKELVPAELVFKKQRCPTCEGEGTEADYVGLEMRCVEVECSACGGDGYIIVASKESK